MTDSSKLLRDSQSELVTIGTGGEELLDQVMRPLLEKGATVGRYVVLSTLGRGGMGVVYAAYDPERDRKIALKLLRPGSGEQSKAVESAARLRREAQALARLSHPNVVTIHDVGTVDDEVFIAMEYIDGVSLGVWVARRRERDAAARAGAWREVLDVFRKAGQGLAAAHAAGLIHRDFSVEVRRRGRILDGVRPGRVQRGTPTALPMRLLRFVFPTCKVAKRRGPERAVIESPLRGCR